jgi:hypothetical protein
VTDLLGLTSFREQIAAILADNLSGDVGVFDCIPDSIAPPSVYVSWSNPWLIHTTFSEFTSAVQLIIVAQRIEPGGQYSVLESLVGEVVVIVRDNHIAIRDVTSPYPINLGGVDYLAASVNIIHEMGD